MRIESNSWMTRSALALGLASAVLAVGACSHNETEPVGGGEPPRETARTLPIPGQGGLPPGHPPTEADEAAGQPVAWKAPETWQQETPDNSVRLAQYRVSGSGGDAECVVFYFGPGQGGDPLANAQRWAGQFTQPDGSDSAAKMQVTEIDSGKLPAMLVEVTGTYDGGMSGDGMAEGYMLLGGIVEGPDAPWFFKFTGPEATVREQRDAFVALLESVTAGGSDV